MNKRKSKKIRRIRRSKTKRSNIRRYKKRHQYGRGFTLTENFNPSSYKDDEYNQFNNLINYEPKIEV